jgi:isopentenyldiphosphate isomerase
MEYLDTYDESGNFIKKEERSIVHRDALWHNTVHCWLFDNYGNIYFQIRNKKNKLYTTASGHVLAGESIKEAFGREIFEEIGYHIDYNDAKKIETVKFIMDREESDGSIFRDRAFANVYACLFKGSLEELDFDEEELSGVVKINAKETLELLKNEKGKIMGEKSRKENGKIIVKKEEIDFNDFLVNKGETAITKYGNVLNFIINEIDNI